MVALISTAKDKPHNEPHNYGAGGVGVKITPGIEAVDTIRSTNAGDIGGKLIHFVENSKGADQEK